MRKRLKAVIEAEGTGYVALCPEVDVASQGDSVAEARANLVEALELFFEVASREEVNRRVGREVQAADLETGADPTGNVLGWLRIGDT